jgi:hypothetical protein
MDALILHKGHHRTGTTTLQRQVFPAFGLPFFCKRPESFIAAFAGSPATWRTQGQDLLAPLPPAAIISAENLSAHKLFSPSAARKDPFLLAAHLKELRRATGPVTSAFADRTTISPPATRKRASRRQIGGKPGSSVRH